MLRNALSLLAAWLVIWPTGSHADQISGKTKARPCVVCHGPLGVSMAPDAPHLAGQPERYVIEQLKAYRSGKRRHEIMSPMARTLNDDDIADLAAWFSSLTIRVDPP